MVKRVVAEVEKQLPAAETEVPAASEFKVEYNQEEGVVSFELGDGTPIIMNSPKARQILLLNSFMKSAEPDYRTEAFGMIKLASLCVTKFGDSGKISFDDLLDRLEISDLERVVSAIACFRDKLETLTGGLYFSVQGQPATTIDDLLLFILIACGGNHNSSYFKFLDMDISECLYHLNIFVRLKSMERGEKDKDKLVEWGFSPEDLMANTVTIVLNAVDQASGVVNRIMSNLDGGLTRSLGRATLAGNLMTSGIEAGLQAINSVAIKANQLFKDAVSTQTSVIATSGNIMKIAGYNFNQATSFVEDFQKEMAKIAKDLPGVAEDFATVGRGIMDDVIPAFAGLDGKLDAIERKAALANLKELATWGTLLGSVANSTPQDTAKDMSKFISKSAGLGELFGNNFFQNNPNVRKNIVKQLTGNEDTPLRDATAAYKTKTSEELRQILLSSLQQDKEVINALTDSVDGVFGMITDSLFGLYTGTFGLLMP